MHGGLAVLEALGVERAAAAGIIRFFGASRVLGTEGAGAARAAALYRCHDEPRDAIDVGCIARAEKEIRNRLGADERRQGRRWRRVKKAEAAGLSKPVA